MASLNVSIPDQLRDWVKHQVEGGEYSSASDYLRDLIRTDKRSKEEHWKELTKQLQPLIDTPDEDFVQTSAAEVKQRARRKLKENA